MTLRLLELWNCCTTQFDYSKIYFALVHMSAIDRKLKKIHGQIVTQSSYYQFRFIQNLIRPRTGKTSIYRVGMPAPSKMKLSKVKFEMLAKALST